MDSSKILDNIFFYSGDLAVLCLIITVSLSLFNFKTLNIPFQRLCYFLIWNLFIEIFARFFSYSGMNNLPLLHLYTIGEFILFSWFYKSLLQTNEFFQKKYWILIVGISVLIVLNSIFFQSVYEFNTLAKTLVQIIIISYAVLYFYNLTGNQSTSPVIEKSLRLINSAVIVYYSGSLFIFMCGQVSFGKSGMYEIFWAFNAVLNLIFQLLVLWGIWKVIYKKISLSS